MTTNTDLSLSNLSKLRGKRDFAVAIVQHAGANATAKQKEKAERLTTEFAALRPLVIKANAYRFPADVVAEWLANA
jgi:hypothetical protein